VEELLNMYLDNTEHGQATGGRSMHDLIMEEYQNTWSEEQAISYDTYYQKNDRNRSKPVMI